MSSADVLWNGQRIGIERRQAADAPGTQQRAPECCLLAEDPDREEPQAAQHPSAIGVDLADLGAAEALRDPRALARRLEPAVAPADAGAGTSRKPGTGPLVPRLARHGRSYHEPVAPYDS